MTIAFEVASPDSDKRPTVAAISHSFSMSIAAIRSFTEKIGPIADNHDHAIINSFANDILSMTGLSSDAAIKILSDETHPDHAVIESQLRENFSSPSGRRRFFRAIRTFNAVPPSAGDLLRRGTLITLVSYLDVVISQLLRAYYKAYPQALSGTDKSISLADLRLLGSIDAAEELILNREIDSLLRESLDGQLNYFNKHFKIDLLPLAAFRDRLIETAQRRHLWVHNEGVINRQFLDRVSPELIQEYDAKEGKKAKLTDQYIRRAIDRINLTGVILIHQACRKWFPDEIELSDDNINMPIYDAICQERHTLAQHLGEYARSFTFIKNETRLNVILNLAQAYKWGGDNANMIRTIDGQDWSTCSLRYRLAIAALRDDTANFFELLERACLSSEIGYDSLTDWPIFKELRKDPRFASIAAKHFPMTAVGAEKAIAPEQAVECPPQASDDAASASTSVA